MKKRDAKMLVLWRNRWHTTLFMRCENVLDLWTRFFNWWNQVGYQNVNFPTQQSENEILFGLPNNGDSNVTVDFCMLHIKHYIYKQRLFHDNDMQFGAIKNMLSVKLEFEKNILSRETSRKSLQNSNYCTINWIFKRRSLIDSRI